MVSGANRETPANRQQPCVMAACDRKGVYVFETNNTEKEALDAYSIPSSSFNGADPHEETSRRVSSVDTERHL